MNPSRLPTEEEWLAWSGQEPTKALRAFAKSKIDSLKAQWAAGAFSEKSDAATLALNHAAVGAVKAWEAVIEMEFQDIIDELGEPDEPAVE